MFPAHYCHFLLKTYALLVVLAVAVALTVAWAVAVAALIDLKRFFRRFHCATLVVLTGHALSNVVFSVVQLLYIYK